MQLLISAGLIAVIVLWGLIAPSSLGSTFDQALVVATKNFGWLYLWVVFGLVLLSAFLALSRYGDLKLGAEDEEPEFSLMAWFAMLFAAGMGIGLVYWGVAEPLLHYRSAPPGIANGTPEAANAAMRYSFFHWGLHPWAIYGIVALSIAYFQFRRGSKALVSSATSTLPWRWAQKLSPMFNVMAVVATAFGVAASLGMGAAQINGGLNTVFGLPVSVFWQAVIIVVVTVLFLISAVTGVHRGVKWLSQANLLLAAFLAFLVFVFGPTVAIIDTLTSTLGAYLSELVRMSLRLTPFRDSAWVGDWTVFYWAWWIAWSPFVGLFIARISRGRTIRQFLLGVVIAPTLVGFVWFSIFGGAALHSEIFNGSGLAEVAGQNSSLALFALLGELPLAWLTSILATILILVFFITSGDSATLVLATMSTDGDVNPKNRTKIIWGVLVSGIALALLMAGGLRAVQTATIVFALPFSLVLVLMAIALVRAIQQDWHAHELRERQLRKEVERLLHPND
ncbi:MAG: BCCT family transporter [Burkholderiaceae bacterium]